MNTPNESTQPNPITSKPIPNSNELAQIPNSDLVLTRLTFAMMGVSGILNWSINLNSILPIFTTIYNFPLGADTILLGYFLFTLIVAAIRLWSRNISPWICYLGVCMLFVTNISVPLIVQFTDDVTGIILIYFITSMIGLGVSLLVGNGFAYSSMLPINFTGYSFAGNGIAGLIGFLAWQFLIQVFFNVEKVNELRYAVWCIYIFSSLILLMTLILLVNITRKNWFQDSLNMFRKTVVLKLDPEDCKEFVKTSIKDDKYTTSQLQGVRPLKFLLKDSIVNLFWAGLSFFISYTVFPEIGPYDWQGLSLNSVSILVGTYQTFDLLGRYISASTNKIRMSRKLIATFTLVRFIFFPIFVFMAIYEYPLTTNMPFQLAIMLIFALSHGICSSQSLADVPRCLKTMAERGLMGIIINISTQAGILLAIFAANAIKITFNI